MASPDDQHGRYKSTVVHLPQHMVDNSDLVDDQYLSLQSNSPGTSNAATSSNASTVHSANAKSIIVVDELAQYLQLEEAPHPTIPCAQRISSQRQTTLLWSMIALFSISILICTMLFAQRSITVLYILQIVCALCGLLLAYFYNANMHFTYSLSHKIDDLLSEQKHLKSEAEELEKKLRENESKEEDHAVVALLDSFRNGDFHKELAYCPTRDIKQLLSVIAHTLCTLPFGLTQFRSNLFVILANRISTDPSLDQSWRFFLHSYCDVPAIKRIWGHHEYCQNAYVKEMRVDSVQWFQSLFDDLAILKSTKTIDPSQFVCDPINGNILVKVQLIARPYRIDCYTLNEVWSSTMVLKRDQDLRRDLGIILMFKYFNQIWKENRVMYKGESCEAITFEVIPMAVDFGCTEWIQNVSAMNDNQDVNTDRLIATAAGCCVALLVCGVAVRDANTYNDGNIRIRKDSALFHMDFAHIFGENADNDLNATALISTMLLKQLGRDQFDQFVEVSVQCFRALRKDCIHILDYSRVVFGFMKHVDQSEQYLKESLMNTTEEKHALDAIRLVFRKNNSN